MPSSRRGWYCSAATRLQPPVAERPARTAPGFGRPCQSRVRGSRSGRARRSRAPRGRRAASFFYADRECGRARRARWAARTPPQALGTRSHAPLSSSPPTALRTADRRSRSNAPARVVGVRALWQSVNQRPLSGWLVPSGMPWCFVLPYIRVKHASWFRALACVCPQTSPRRALSSSVWRCVERVSSRVTLVLCVHMAVVRPTGVGVKTVKRCC